MNLTVTEADADHVAASEEGSKTVTISANETSATYTLPTVDDTSDEGTSTVVVSVESGTGYTIHNSRNTDLVWVMDDDPPKISITGGNAVTEGGDATFTVSALTPPTTELKVILMISESGDYVAAGDEGSKHVYIPASHTSVTYTVATVDDSYDEANGSVAVIVTPGTGYSVAAAPDNAASVTINDDDVPEISISGGSAVTEGGDATFTVSTIGAPTADLTVNLTISESGDHVVAGNEGSKTVTITGGTTSATYTVATVDDSSKEANGSVTATVETGTGYTVHGTNNTASVTVNDNDVPVISISGGNAVTEGDDATFTVSALTAPAADLTVSESGDYVASGDEGPKTVTISANATSATYTVSTVNDSADEADGTVTVTLARGTGYTVHGTDNADSVDVNDDDAAPTVTLVLSASTISENGGSATVTATLDHASSHPTTITVSVAAGPNTLSTHYSLSANRSLSIGAGALTSTGTVTITAVDDTVFDSLQKSVDVSGSASNSQGITGPSTVNLQISDDESTPTLTMSDVSAVEGNDLEFTVTMSTTPMGAASLSVAVTPSGTNPVDSSDYTAPSATATIPTGNSSVTISVSSSEDSDPEADEQFTITIDGTIRSGTSLRNFATIEATGTIINDDSLKLSTPPASPSTKTLDLGQRTVTVNRSGTVPEMVELELPEQPTENLIVTISEAASSVARQSPLYGVDGDSAVDIDVQGLAGQSTTICMLAPADSQIRRASESTGKPLQIGRYEDGKWNPLDSTDDGTHVCAVVASFSSFAKLFEFSLSVTSSVLEHVMTTIGSQIMSSAIGNIRTQFDSGRGTGSKQLQIAGQSIPLSGGGYSDPFNGGVVRRTVCAPAVAAHRGGSTLARPGVGCHAGTPFNSGSQSRTLSLGDRELLARSSFTLSLSDADAADASGHRWSIWGRGDYTNFSRDSGEPATYDGSLESFYLGVDAHTDEWLKGVAIGEPQAE